MERFFNTEGPCDGAKHYMLPAESRVDDHVERLIDRQRCFVIHAPRQVGRTTSFCVCALARCVPRLARRIAEDPVPRRNRP